MSLNSIDKRLLYELDKNARVPLSVIAKKLRVSKQVLLYRFERLQKEGYVTGFYTEINPAKLGLTMYLIYFKFQHLENEQKLIEHLNKHPRVSYNVATQGRWDHSISIFARDIYDFKESYDAVMTPFEKYVRQKLVTIMTNFSYQRAAYFLGKREQEKEVIMSGPMSHETLDDIDKKLLMILSEHARLPLVEITDKLCLAPNTVKFRMRQLESKGIVMGYRPMINHNKLGKKHYRIFLFFENAPERVRSLRTFLAGLPETISMSETIGYCEMECRVIVDGIDHLYTLIASIKQNYGDILKDHETLLYYKFYKSLNYYPME